MVNPTATTSLVARGTLFVHACTRVLASPLEWVITDVLGAETHLQWSAQPIAPAMVRSELAWVGEPGTAAKLASGLRSIPNLRFEVTEHSTGFNQRISYTPSLGIFRADIDQHGNIVINEEQLRSLVAGATGSLFDLHTATDRLLGAAWDAELEPFRVAADGDSVRWVHRVG